MHMFLHREVISRNGIDWGGTEVHVHSIDAGLNGDLRVVHVASNVAQYLAYS